MPKLGGHNNVAHPDIRVRKESFKTGKLKCCKKISELEGKLNVTYCLLKREDQLFVTHS